jgi:hypothetical protein
MTPKKPSAFDISMRIWMGVMLIFLAALGVYWLALPHQPKAETPVISSLRQTNSTHTYSNLPTSSGLPTSMPSQPQQQSPGTAAIMDAAYNEARQMLDLSEHTPPDQREQYLQTCTNDIGVLLRGLSSQTMSPQNKTKYTAALRDIQARYEVLTGSTALGSNTRFPPVDSGQGPPQQPGTAAPAMDQSEAAPPPGAQQDQSGDQSTPSGAQQDQSGGAPTNPPAPGTGQGNQ